MKPFEDCELITILSYDFESLYIVYTSSSYYLKLVCLTILDFVEAGTVMEVSFFMTPRLLLIYTKLNTPIATPSELNLFAKSI